MRAYLAVILVLGFTQIGGQAQMQNLNKADLEKAIEDFASKNCPALVHNTQAREKIMDDTQNLVNYANSTMMNLITNRPEFCSRNVPNMKRKYDVLVDDFKLCFKNETEYLVDFGKGVIGGLLDFICNNNARNLEELLSFEAQSCVRSIQIKGKGPEFKSCLKSLQESGQELKSKDELCRDLGVIRSCVGDTLDRHCSDWGERRRINRELFESIMKPCPSGASIFSFSAILLIFTVIHKYLF